MYTNSGLIKHCQKALSDKTVYMWGGIYRPVTISYINMLAKIYPKQYPEKRRKFLSEKQGFFGVDCVGLVKSYYWSGNADGGKNSPKYGASGFPDVNAGGMYSAAKVKGAINTLPEIKGVILYSKSNPHIGVYAGNGQVYESTLGKRGDGVVLTKLSDFGWEYWFFCPYISYEEDTASKSESKKLSVGDKVRVSKNCKTTYNGGGLSSKYVANGTTLFDVIEIKGNRVVIGISGRVTAAVHIKYLIY